MEILKTLLALATIYEFFAFGIVVVYGWFVKVNSKQMIEIRSAGLTVLFVYLITDFVRESKDKIETDVVGSGDIIYSFWDYTKYSFFLLITIWICIAISHSIYCEIKEKVLIKNKESEMYNAR